MKKVRFIGMLLFASLVSFGLASCGDDDEPGGSSAGATGSGVLRTDERTISYNRGQYVVDMSGNHTIELIFTDYDFKTLPDQLVNMLSLSINYDGSTLPEGTIPYSNSSSQKPYWDLLDAEDYNPRHDVNAGDDDLSGTYFYSTDWNRGYESSAMTITRTSTGYRIEIPSIRLLKSADNEGIGQDDEKMNGSFVWEGSMEDVTDWVNQFE